MREEHRVATADEQLMLAVRGGSREAFETLFDRYRDVVWRFFRRRVSDAGRAEELAQETFLAILQGSVRYEPRAPFRAYLFGVAYRTLFADRRTTARQSSEALDVEPAAALGDPDLGLWVRQAIAQLDEDDREILMLREYEQLTYQEIAELRRVPINTVKSRLFRARMALKAALDARAPVEMRHESR